MSRQPLLHARAWVEVDLDALRRNATVLAARAGVPLLPMVKADAYGLGAVRVARALQSLSPWGFGVATVHEGEELRSAGIREPVLVFTPLVNDELDRARKARLTPCLGSAEAVQRWGGEGRPWHLAIDTGMSRAGVRWDRVGDMRDMLINFPPEGAFTHFHSAERNDGSLALQEQRFDEVIRALPVRPRLLHTSNSAAITRQETSRYDLVRPGVFLYGGATGIGAGIEPEPVVHLRAPVVDLRDLADGETVSYGGTYRAVGQRRIATLPVGYADGYRRQLGNRANVLINGHRAPVAGVVTMDMTLVDVTDAPCALGDVATLIGRDGGDLIPLDDLATLAETISYELLTGLRLRAERVYLGGV